MRTIARRTFSSTFSSFFSSAAAAGAPPAAAAGAAPPPPPPDGTEASFADPSAISFFRGISIAFENTRSSKAYRVNILAAKLGNEGLEAGLVGLDADGSEDLLDIRSGGGGVAADLEEQVSSNETHFWSLFGGVVGVLYGSQRSLQGSAQGAVVSTVGYSHLIRDGKT